MTRNITFFISNLVAHLVTELGGFFLGSSFVMDFFINRYNLLGRSVEAEGYAVGIFGLFGGLAGMFLGILSSLIISHRLGKKFGSKLSFGSHPVLKLTSLSLFSSILILITVLLFIPKE